MRTRPRVVIVGVLALSAAACAGGDDQVSTRTSSDASVPTTAASTAPAPAATGAAASTEEPAAGEWIVSEVPIVTEGLATQSDLPVQPPEIHAFGRTSAGWLAAGYVNGGFTVWRSDDLASFEPVHAEVCCERSVRATAIAELDGVLLIGGTQNLPDGTARALLERSDDGGVTWSPVDGFTSSSSSTPTPPPTRVDRIVTTADTVIVEAVDDSGFAAGWRPTLVWSDDLVTWNPVELPGARETDWPMFVDDGTTVWALVARAATDGTFLGWSVWRSDDGARTFVGSATLDTQGGGAFVAVGGSLVALPSVFQGENLHADAAGPAVLRAGGEWEQLPADTGTWGDGTVVAPRTEMGDGALPVILVTREMRASAHYCYADIASCEQYESALITSADGVTWSELADVPGLDDLSFGSSVTVRSDPDGIVVARVASGESVVHVTRWTSGATPPMTERPDYPPPDIPLPLYEGGTDVEVGSEVRYVLGLGGCGGMYLGDQRWEPETPLPDPPPPEWPYRAVEIADGPAGYLYGRILRTAPDAIELSLDGIGTVATFHPAPSPEFACG